MLLFGDGGSKPKKGTGRAPPGPSRPRGLQANADPNKGGFSQKRDSPSNLFVPNYNEPDALRLPRLPTPDQREGPQRDSLRPTQQPDSKLQPVSARDPIQRGEDDDNAGDGENRHDNRRRGSSPMVVQEQPSFRQRSRIEDDDERPEDEGRIIRVDSRLDGRAWEGDAEGERDPVAASFREAKMQCQVLRKKEGSKDFPNELKALEARLKSLEGQVMRDRITIIKRAKEQKHNSSALQKNLQDARSQMHQTMAQAADDVIVLTQKLKSVEEEFAQCRVDRDYEKMSFQNEKEIMRAQNKDVEEQLMKARTEASELSRRMKSAGEEVKLLTKLKADGEHEQRLMQERLDALQDEVSQLKSSKSQLERQVMTLEGDLSLEKNNVKNEVARVQMERERHAERVAALTQQLEAAQQDGAWMEDYRTEAAELKRKFQQAEKLLDEAEEVRKEALKNAHLTAEQDKAEAVGKVTAEAEALRRQLTAAQEEKADAQARAQARVQELQGEVAAANARVGEMTQSRVDAQEQLSLETEKLLAQVRRGQEEVARAGNEAAELQERMLKEQAAAQSAQLELKSEMAQLRSQAQEAQLKLKEAQGQLERAEAERGEAEGKARELRERLAAVERAGAEEELREEVRRLKRELEEARREAAQWQKRAGEAEEEAARQRREAAAARREAEQEGVAAAKAAAEKEVFAGMVKDLIAQLSRARMDSLAAVANRDMPLDQQAAHLQALLASAKAQKAHTEEIKRKGDPAARRQLVDKFVSDYRSSRSSSVLSLADGVPVPLPAPSPLPAPAPAPDTSAAHDASVQPPSEVSLVAREPSDASEPDRNAEPKAEAEAAAAPEEAAVEAAAAAEEDSMAGVGESLVVEAAGGEDERPEMVITPSLPSTPGNRSPVGELEEEEEAAAAAGAAEGVGGEGAEGGEREEGLEAEVGAAPAEGGEGGAGEEAGEAGAGGGSGGDEKELEAAVLKIQARARGMRDREKVRAYLEEQMAAYEEDDFEEEHEEAAADKPPLAAQGSQRSMGGREGSGGEREGGRRGGSAGSRGEGGGQKPRPPESRPEGVGGGSFRNRSGSRGGSRPGSALGAADALAGAGLSGKEAD